MHIDYMQAMDALLVQGTQVKITFLQAVTTTPVTIVLYEVGYSCPSW